MNQFKLTHTYVRPYFDNPSSLSYTEWKLIDRYISDYNDVLRDFQEFIQYRMLRW